MTPIPEGFVYADGRIMPVTEEIKREAALSAEIFPGHRPGAALAALRKVRTFTCPGYDTINRRVVRHIDCGEMVSTISGRTLRCKRCAAKLANARRNKILQAQKNPPAPAVS